MADRPCNNKQEKKKQQRLTAKTPCFHSHTDTVNTEMCSNNLPYVYLHAFGGGSIFDTVFETFYEVAMTFDI